MASVRALPDCNDPQVIQNEYTAFNKSINECWIEREYISMSRIYFIVAIVNGVCIILTTALFIFFAKGTSTVKMSSTISSRQLQQLQKRHSIQQRSVKGTTLGAIGHLVFSTCLLLSQAFPGSIGCELLLWGVCIGFYTWMSAFFIRAYRLRFMFRLNQLKVKYLRMSSSDRFSQMDDKDYQWYISHKNNVKRSLIKPYLYYLTSIAFIVAIAVPVEVFSVRRQGYCQLQRGIGLFIGLFAVFILFAIPFILWYLKDNGDAHGIRQELWIDAALGIIMFTIYMALFFTLQPDALNTEVPYYLEFRPGNIPVIYTAFAHIMSVVLPVIAFLPIYNKRWVKFKSNVYNKFTLKRGPILASNNTSKAISLEENADPSTSNSIADMELVPELSIESLEKSLFDHEKLRQLQDLAIRDFSSENVLFYEKYLYLENRFKQLYVKSESDGSALPRNWIQSYILRKSPVAITPPPPSDETGIDVENVANYKELSQERNLQKFLSTPIPYKLYPAFIQFYETFIAEDTSSQVNISHRARHSIDVVFESLYQQYPELNPKIESSSSSRSIVHTLASRVSADEPFAKEKSRTYQHELEEHPVLTLGVFEAARIEVCWNIFNSVYPKFVEMYNCNNNTTTP